jgi:GxxExxY protein
MNTMVLEESELTEMIIGCAMRVHSALGPGFLESVYQRALEHELRKSGLRVECQLPLSVHYDGVIVGDFMADLIVEGKVMIELKANQALVVANEAQLVNYLTATRIEVGLLINFGAQRLEFKRKTRLSPEEVMARGQPVNPVHPVQDHSVETDPETAFHRQD